MGLVQLLPRKRLKKKKKTRTRVFGLPKGGGREGDGGRELRGQSSLIILPNPRHSPFYAWEFGTIESLNEAQIVFPAQNRRIIWGFF